MTSTTARLDALAAVPAGYRHTAKQILAADELDLPGARLKWYDIHPAGRPTPDRLREQARAFLRAEAGAGTLELRGELGYAMLHLDGEGYFLLVAVWRNTNELWQALYAHEGDGFVPYPPAPGPLRPTQNVFELDCTAHERRAWSRYLGSERAESDKLAYLADRCAGELS